MEMALITTQGREKKAVNPSLNKPLVSVFFAVASSYKTVKSYCISTFGYRLNLDTFWLLLLLGCLRGVASSGLHVLFNHSVGVVSLRMTVYRLSALVKCGLVVRSTVCGVIRYSLSFQAEKLLFSGIDKSDLLELSAMVKSIQDEDKAKVIAKRKKVVRSVVKPSK